MQYRGTVPLNIRNVSLPGADRCLSGCGHKRRVVKRRSGGPSQTGALELPRLAAGTLLPDPGVYNYILYNIIGQGDGCGCIIQC